MKLFITIGIFMISTLTLFANNVAVTSVRLTNQNTTIDVKDIEFDISWDNSWRTSASPSYYDACWLFAKYRLTNSTIWNHASVSTTDGDHNAPAGSVFISLPVENHTGVP